ncbi:MAG: hypothetical protein DRJ59_00845 [Thermoprotei archaeon]|nr:MAG: hypothetical protein DRJ59_00845 [Thermoprotei archaeon]
MELTAANFRIEAPRFIFSRLAEEKNVVIDAPPGLGKTRSAAKAAIRLVREIGQRVVIIEPTKTLRSQVASYIRKEDPEIEIHESKAWSDYSCPIINAPADPAFCSYRKDICEEERLRCGVLQDIKMIGKSKLTVATFAKLLMSKGSFAGYNTVIVDESHGFENAETSFLQTYVMFDRLREIAGEVEEEYPELAEELNRLADGLLRMNQMLGDSELLTMGEIDRIREAFESDVLRRVWLECAREGKYPRYRRLYSDLQTLHFRMQNIAGNIFFFYEGALYGRPKNMEAEIAGFFKDKNVCLLSATVEDPARHARECGLDMRRFDQTCGVVVKDYPEVRRRNRMLVALKDGPVLSKADEEKYAIARKRANEILLEILSRFTLRSLVLFRSYGDQRMAWEFLSATPVAPRIQNIWQGEDPEEIEKKIRKLREGDIVLTSASARLWEGVDIPGLRLVVIDALPYPGKDPLDRKYNFRAGYETMLKRLKQGLGRIVRSDDDWGAAVVIDRRFTERFPSIAPRLPWFMGEDFRKMRLTEALSELDEFVRKRGGTSVI